MANTTNDRVISLLKTLKIDEMEAAKRCSKHPQTFYRITNKETTPTRSTLETIANGLGANYNWLLTGLGDMIAETVTTASKTKQEAVTPWKDEAFKAVKEENSRLQKEIERLWQLIGNDRKVNFLKAPEQAGATVHHLKGNAVAHSGAKAA